MPAPVIPQINGDDLTFCNTEGCFGVGHEILGIDIGGTSIKAAPVDTHTGKLIAEEVCPAHAAACHSGELRRDSGAAGTTL